MKKPTVHLVKGLHITASDKKNIVAILDTIEGNYAAFVESSPQTVPPYGAVYYQRKGSPKSYAITPRQSEAGTYDVVILQRCKTDYGVDQSRKWPVTIRVKNRAPLYRPDYDQPDTSPNLFTKEELSQ